MAKAQRGERNRGQIVAKGEGRWLVRFYKGRDASGKRVYPAKIVEGTFKQAERELTKLLSASDSGTYVAPSKMTLKDYVTEWLKGKLNLSAKTARDYEARLESDVLPTLGDIRLEHITPLQVQNVFGAMHKKGLSPRTIEYTHTVLSQSFEAAVRNDILPKNPAKYVELPKKVRTRPVVFSPSDASLFLEKTSESKWHPLWVTLLTSGLRPQEAAALTWDDVALDSRMIRVQQALVEVRPGIYEVGPVKTEKGVRAISIPEVTIETLRAHRKQQGVIAGFVFQNQAGHHYDLSRIRKAWYKDIDATNRKLLQECINPLPIPKLYGARHSHITHLLMAGVHPKVASERAGHSTTQMTMEVYSHVLPEMDRQVADRVGELLFAPKKAVAQ